MSLIYTPSRKIQRNLRPDFPVRIRTNHPLASYIKYYFIPGIGEITKNSPITLNNFASYGVDRYGRSGSVITSTDNFSTPNKVLNNSNTHTILIVSNPASMVQRWDAVTDAGGDALFDQYTLAFNSNSLGVVSAGLFSYFDYSGAFNASADSASSMVDGSWHQFAVSRNAASSLKMFRDGIDVTNSSSPSASTHSTSNQTQRIGMGVFSFDCVIIFDGIALSGSQLRDLLPLPHFALLEPVQKSIFIPLSSGTNSFTISPTGQVTFSGTNTQVRGKVFNNSGQLTLSGTNEQVKGKIFVPSGQITFSGTSPNIRGNVFNNTGQVTFSGNSPFTSVNSFTINPTGSLTFSGTNLTIKSKVISPSGTVQFSGTSPVSIVASYILSPSGQITFSGTNTTIKSKIISPTGQLTFSGTSNLLVPDSGDTQSKMIISLRRYIGRR